MNKTQIKIWKSAQYHLNEAIDLHGAENYEGALVEIDKAIREVTRSEGVFWSMKSRVLYSMGRLDEAEKAARKSNDLNEDFPLSWGVLGETLIDKGKYQEAALALQKSVALEESYSTYTILAAAELRFDPQAAAEHARRALELNPDWEEAASILERAEELSKKDAT